MNAAQHRPLAEMTEDRLTRSGHGNTSKSTAQEPAWSSESVTSYATTAIETAEKHTACEGWWHTAIIPTLKKLKQERFSVTGSLGYTEKSFINKMKRKHSFL